VNTLERRKWSVPRVVHFDLTAANPDRAAKFYGQVFGWTFEKWTGPMEYWMVKTGTDKQPGINGGLSRRDGGAAAGTTTTVDVPSVDEASAKITKSGGKIIRPKAAIPGVGYFALCQDTEGNTFGIMQFDQKAK
jgi:predicted enzyme related to lactoylglutathione lyase